MLYLLKKVLRDIWIMKIQFIAVMLMSMLGIMFYSAMEGAWYGMQESGAAYFTEANLADVWIYCTQSTEDDLKKIEEMEQVKYADMHLKLNIRSIIDDRTTYLELVHSYRKTVSKDYLIDGTSYEPNGEGIWLDSNYAEANGFEVGDNITIDHNGNLHQLEIKGLIQNPDYIAYTGSISAATLDSKLYGYCMVGANTIEDLIGGKFYNVIKVVLNEGCSVKEFKDLLDEKLNEVYITAIDRDKNINISPFLDKSEQIRSMSILFSALFLCLAFLTMYISMKRLINVQRVQLGTLGALGFSKSAILISCSLYGMIISTIGAVIGLILGENWLAGIILNLQKDFYSMPLWNTGNTYMPVAVLFATILCCTITAVLTSRSTAREMPATSMRKSILAGGKQLEYKKKKHQTTDRLFPWKWMLRDVYRNKVRSIISIIGVCGSVVVLFAAFGLYDSLEYTCDYIYHTQYAYNNKVSFITSAGKEEIDRLCDAIGSGQSVEETSVYIESQHNEMSAVAIVLEEGSMIKLQTEDGTPVSVTDGDIILTRGSANELEVEAGDEIYFRKLNSNQKTKCVVSKIVHSPSPQGMYLSENTWNELGYTFLPTAMYTREEIDESSLEKYIAFREVISKDTQEKNTAEVLKSAIDVVAILIGAAVFLCIVILYNLGSISYIEKEREYATLLVLGFRNKEICGIIMREFIFQTFVGWIFGLPLGYLFLNIYVQTVSSDTMKYLSYITPLGLLYITAIEAVCSLVVALFIYAKTRKIDMCETLKAVE